MIFFKAKRIKQLESEIKALKSENADLKSWKAILKTVIKQQHTYQDLLIEQNVALKEYVKQSMRQQTPFDVGKN